MSQGFSIPGIEGQAASNAALESWELSMVLTE